MLTKATCVQVDEPEGLLTGSRAMGPEGRNLCQATLFSVAYNQEKSSCEKHTRETRVGSPDGGSGSDLQ